MKIGSRVVLFASLQGMAVGEFDNLYNVRHRKIGRT
jgi:hypothetical protein